MSKPELYFSTDIEANGKIPYKNSMLSFASAAFTADKKLLGTFSANLEELPGSVGDKSTMEWWATQPVAWEACRKDLQDPKVAMTNFVNWVESFKEYTPVFVAYPAGYDFTWMHWYCEFFVDRDPFGFSAYDVKSYASAVMKTNFKSSTKRNMPNRWFEKTEKHTHVALDDAKEQGLLFLNMMQENLKSKQT